MGPLLRQCPLRTSRSLTSGRLVVLAQAGKRSTIWPAQVQQNSLTTGQRRTPTCVRQGRQRGQAVGRRLVVRAVAMVNVDFASPSLLLGGVLIFCGIVLLNLRHYQNKVSRDADIVVAAMVSIVGSTLIFQGWRLDPLLLLCQALTTSVAFWYGLETFRLRSKEADAPIAQLPPGLGSEPSPDAMQQFYQQQQAQPPPGMPGYPPTNNAPFLPPASQPYYPWGGAAGPSTSAATSGRMTGVSVPVSNPYAETIQYDYYGNPITPPEPSLYTSTSYSPQYSSSYDGQGDPYSAEAAAGGGYPAAGTFGYNTRGGPPPSTGPGSGSSYDAAAGLPVGPYGSQMGPMQPSSSAPQQPQLQQGWFPSLGTESGVQGSQGSFDDVYGTGSSGGLPPAGPAVGTYGGVAGGAAGWTGTGAGGLNKVGEGVGSGEAGGGSGRGQPTRVDRFEVIGDWE